MLNAPAIARKRVPLGFAVAALTLIVADPTWQSWTAGLAIAVAGEAIRVWAAGHLEKSREVTRSGPYRFVGHPLYVGSVLVAAGVIVAARHVLVTAVGLAYLVVTFTAAVRTEEFFLRAQFGETYEQYRESRGEPMRRRFSLERARRNREYRAVLGLAAGFALLALKILATL